MRRSLSALVGALALAAAGGFLALVAGSGARSAAAIPKLLELFKVKDKDLHHAVTEALKKIDQAEAAKVGAE